VRSDAIRSWMPWVWPEPRSSRPRCAWRMTRRWQRASGERLKRQGLPLRH